MATYMRSGVYTRYVDIVDKWKNKTILTIDELPKYNSTAAGYNNNVIAYELPEYNYEHLENTYDNNTAVGYNNNVMAYELPEYNYEYLENAYDDNNTKWYYIQDNIVGIKEPRINDDINREFDLLLDEL